MIFARLAKNVAITGAAYVVISAIGLVLAPLLIAAYGLSGYGLILLARFVLPTAAFGFLDLGLGENTTRIVAQANTDGDRQRAGEGLGLQIALAIAIGSTTGLVVYAAAGSFADWFSLEPGMRDGFNDVMQITAWVLPLLFGSLVAEGVLKGCEQFGRQRACELLSALIYGGLTFWLVARGAGPNTICLALLAGLVARMALASVFAWAALRHARIAVGPWSREVRRDQIGWTRSMLFNKLLGTAQSQAASPLLGLLVGPAAVGLFDAIVRIPRLLKQVFSLLSSVVLPVAVRLKAADARDGTRDTARLATTGIGIAAGLCIPLAVIAAAYSRAILDVWFGAEIAQDWGWQSLMFAVPAMTVLISFGGAILLADKAAFRQLNRIAAVQVALQLALSLALLPTINPFSFVIGQVVSMALVLPFQIALAAPVLGLGPALGVRLAAVAGVSVALAASGKAVVPAPDLAGLLAMLALLTAGAYATLPFLVLERCERTALVASIRGFISNTGSASGAGMGPRGRE